MAFLPSTAMGMPQKDAFEYHILGWKENESVSFPLRGVADLIHFTAGRVEQFDASDPPSSDGWRSTLRSWRRPRTHGSGRGAR